MKKPLNPAFSSPESRIRKMIDELENLKIGEIVILDLRGVTDFTDFFVIATAGSSVQMSGVMRRIYDSLKKEGHLPYAPFEDESPRWSILDYGDIILHLFEKETREHYQLEQAWGDAEEIGIDDLPALARAAS